MPQHPGSPYRAGMSSHLVAVTFDAHHPADLATFWSGLLGREVLQDGDRGALLPGGPTQVGLRFVPAATERTGPNRLHLHLTTTSLDDSSGPSSGPWSSAASTATWASSPRRTTWCWPTPAATSSA